MAQRLIAPVKRDFRLRSVTDFERVRRLGRSYAHPLMVLITMANQEGLPRFGIAASRTVGSAVQRNRAKRLIRAAIRTLDLERMPGWDVIVIARKPMKDADFHQTLSGLRNLVERSKLIVTRRSNNQI